MDDELRGYMTGDARPRWMKRTVMGVAMVCACAAAGLSLQGSPAAQSVLATTKTMASHAVERVASMRPEKAPAISEEAVVEDITTTSSAPVRVRVNRPVGQAISTSGAKRIQLDSAGGSVNDKPGSTARQGF